MNQPSPAEVADTAIRSAHQWIIDHRDRPLLVMECSCRGWKHTGTAEARDAMMAAHQRHVDAEVEKRAPGLAAALETSQQLAENLKARGVFPFAHDDRSDDAHTRTIR